MNEMKIGKPSRAGNGSLNMSRKAKQLIKACAIAVSFFDRNKRERIAKIVKKEPYLLVATNGKKQRITFSQINSVFIEPDIEIPIEAFLEAS